MNKLQMNLEKTLKDIRRRDLECGENIPQHWQAQLDRRFLIQLLDKVINEHT